MPLDCAMHVVCLVLLLYDYFKLLHLIFMWENLFSLYFLFIFKNMNAFSWNFGDRVFFIDIFYVAFRAVFREFIYLINFFMNIIELTVKSFCFFMIVPYYIKYLWVIRITFNWNILFCPKFSLKFKKIIWKLNVLSEWIIMDIKDL